MTTSSNPTILNNLIPGTAYSVIVSSICPNNDTSYNSSPIGFTTECIPRIAPFTENFDSIFPICWSQEDVSDDFDWTLNSGPPPTLQNGFQTGPSDDITGGGSYIYTEATPQDQGDQAILYSDSIDISSLTNPQLNFYYHMYGDDMGDLDIEIYNGNNYINIFSISGDQGNQWIKDSIPIYSSSNIIIFRITGTIGDGWSSDMAIDNFEITEGPTCPAPSFLTSSNITSNSAEISWSASTNANSWIINYNGNFKGNLLFICLVLQI